MSATLTVREAAEILSCNPETVRRMCRKGDLKSVKLGSSVRSTLRIPINQDMIAKALGGAANKSLLALVDAETEEDKDEAFFE